MGRNKPRGVAASLALVTVAALLFVTTAAAAAYQSREAPASIVVERPGAALETTTGPGSAFAASTGPDVLNVDSLTHPDPNQWYPNRSVTFRWEGSPVSYRAGRVLDGSWVYCVQVVDDVAFVGYEGGLLILDVSDPGNATELGSYTSRPVQAIDVRNGHAYCVWSPADPSQNRVFVLDVSDPTDPQPVGEIAPPGSPQFPELFQTSFDTALVVTADQYAYVPFEDFYNPSAINHYIGVLDVSDPANPVWVAYCQVDDSVNHLLLNGDYLYAAGSQHLATIDVSDPAAPALLGSTDADSMGLARDGGSLFTGDSSDASKTDAFGLEAPASPAFLGSLLCFHSGVLMSVDDLALTDTSLRHHYLIVAYDAAPTEFEWVEILDVTPPLTYGDASLLRYRGDVAGPENDRVNDLTVAGDWVYVAQEYFGMTISHIGPDAYSYVFDKNPGTIPDTISDGDQSGLGADATVTATSDGVWYFHVRAEDHSGSWGPTATRKVQIGTGPTDTTPPVTTASGYDASWHKAPVTVTFSATDPGAGASGVAYTEHRLDAGSWTRGASCTVPAPANTSHVYTVGYRSVDVAGNVEAEKTVQVKIDTTTPAPSISTLTPMHGLPGSTVTISGTNLRSSGTVKFGTTSAATSSWSATQIACTVPNGLSPGALSVTVASGGKTSNPLTFTVEATVVDITPPVTTASGYDDAWHSAPVTVSFSATDPGSGASGVAYTEHRLDAGRWTRGASCTVPAPANTSHVYTVGYRSADQAGNVEAAKSCQVKLDTRKPTTAAPSAAKVRKGRTAKLKYKVKDAAPNGGTATVKIKIKNRAGKVVKVLKLGVKNVNVKLSAKFRCRLAKGRYKFLVYAVDAAGNKQGHVGSNRLTVR